MAKKYQSGQILLVVILTMVVALTVGLSLAARMVTELRLSKQNEESQRAFQAAEAGVQKALANAQLNYSVTIPNLGNNASYIAEKESNSGLAILLNNGLIVDQSVGADVWLSNYSTNPSLLYRGSVGCDSNELNCNPVPIKIYWGTTQQTDCIAGSGENTAPALEITLLKGPIASPTIQRTIIEAAGCGTSNRTTTNASTISVSSVTNSTLKDVKFRYSANLVFGNPSLPLSNGLIMKIIPIFNSTIIGLQIDCPHPTYCPSGSSTNYQFPAQGSIVTSTGASGDTVRKVVYYQSFPQMPLEVFPYSLLSQ